MGTLSDKLNFLNETKQLMKQALIDKGVNVSDTDSFRSYVDKIGQIKGGSGDTPTLTMPSYLTEVEFTHLKGGSKTSGIAIPFVPTLKTKLEMKFTITGYSTSSGVNRQVLGSYSGTEGDNTWGLFVYKDGVFTSTFGAVLVNRKYAKLGTAQKDVDYMLIMDSNSTILNDVEYLYTGLETEEPLTQDWVADNPLYIFPGGNVAVDYVAYIKLYYAKIYEENVLRHDLIPVQHNVSGNYGLYDKVTGGYFENTHNISNYTGGQPIGV